MRTLVHLSDLHFDRIDPAVLGPLRSAVHEAKPDLVAISGDFTHRARRSQFAAARAFLDTLQPPKLVVPGNHDVPYWNLARRFLQPLTRYRRYISDDLEPEYEDDEMIVLGVNTARALAHGGGRISAGQVERIVRRLAALPPSVIRIIVTHHPFDLPPGVRERRLLGRARMAMARLSKANADLFLSGHLHLSHASRAADRYRIEGLQGSSSRPAPFRRVAGESSRRSTCCASSGPRLRSSSTSGMRRPPRSARPTGAATGTRRTDGPRRAR